GGTHVQRLVLRVAVETLFLLPVSARAQLDAGAAKPPVAKKMPKSIALHGDTIFDDYFWLREKANSEVTTYLVAENTYTAAVTKPIEALREALYKEMLGRIKETDLSVPYKLGDSLYYTR